MSWGNKKQRSNDEAIGAFKRQRKGEEQADEKLNPWQLRDNVKLSVVAWGADFQYGARGKGGSALACFSGIHIHNCWNPRNHIELLT